MMTRLNMQELVDAFDWVSGADAVSFDSEAFVSRATGKVHWSGDGVDEELPDDIEDASKYLAVPNKRDLDLGRSLAIRFAEEVAPDLEDDVRECFRKSGAYSRFKRLLDRAGKLQAWYDHEKMATEQALRDWCDENGLEIEERR